MTHVHVCEQPRVLLFLAGCLRGRRYFRGSRGLPMVLYGKVLNVRCDLCRGDSRRRLAGCVGIVSGVQSRAQHPGSRTARRAMAGRPEPRQGFALPGRPGSDARGDRAGAGAVLPQGLGPDHRRAVDVGPRSPGGHAGSAPRLPACHAGDPRRGRAENAVAVPPGKPRFARPRTRRKPRRRCRLVYRCPFSDQLLRNAYLDPLRHLLRGRRNRQPGVLPRLTPIGVRRTSGWTLVPAMYAVPLTIGRALTAWTLDLPAVLVVLAAAVLYVRAARRQAGWPPGRTVAFLAGLASIVVVTCSALATYDTTLFWPRAVQTTTLLMITPLFLALGAPVTLLVRTVPSGAAARLRRLGRGSFARAATFPPVVTAILVAPLLVLYLTPLYDLTLRLPVVDGLVRAMLVAAGFVYFWTRIRLDPTPREDSHLVSVWIAFTEVIFDGALGLVLWLGPLLAP